MSVQKSLNEAVVVPKDLDNQCVRNINFYT